MLWRSRDHLGLAHIRFGAPRPVKLAWDASFELHGAVCGAGVGVTQFAEALVGEADAGPHPPRTDVFQLPATRDWDALETLLFLNTRQWAHLPDEPADDGAIVVLAEASRLFGEVGDGAAGRSSVLRGWDITPNRDWG
jgi:hypothetical protein